MNKWQKIGLIAGTGAAAVTITHIINQMIFTAAVRDGVTNTDNRLFYKWKFGNISYTRCGSGRPVLLVHDLNSSSNAYEWNIIQKELAKTYTVYAIDLLGCGYSEKPSITYTAYLYVQLLNDFVTNIIGKRTDIVATGGSAPLAIMACYNNSSLFDKIILVNPESIGAASRIPNKQSNALRILLNIPVLGTALYNLHMSRVHTVLRLKKAFYKESLITPEYITAYHESSHLTGSAAKNIYISTTCHYTTASIGRALSEINNCIYILAGDHETEIDETIHDYLSVNPAIECAYVKDTGHLPQLERPSRFMTQLKIFL